MSGVRFDADKRKDERRTTLMLLGLAEMELVSPNGKVPEGWEGGSDADKSSLSLEDKHDKDKRVNAKGKYNVMEEG